MAESVFSQSKPLIPSWSSTPLPSLSLSAAGLLALADLNTIAQRTVITGGSSWLDALVLAPGLHYQQAFDALDQQSSPGLSAVLQVRSPSSTGDTRHAITNPAMAQYIRRLWQEAGPTKDMITVDVSSSIIRGDAAVPVAKSPSGRFLSRTTPEDIDWLSHVFYLSSPVLTLTSGTLMTLLADWWGLSFVAALMVSRVLNIWSIKQRARPSRNTAKTTTADPDQQRAEYAVDLGHGSRVILSGLASDIEAVTTQVWLRKQSVSEGYLEAGAKLIVYLVAAFSGNLTQAGAMVLMALLLTSAGLLGLSNAHATNLRINGRIAKLRRAVAAVAAEAGTYHDSEQGRGENDWLERLPKAAVNASSRRDSAVAV